MAERVVVWIDRQDGGREANVGTFERRLTDANGRRVHGSDGRALLDHAYADEVQRALDGYDGASVADVLADLTQRRAGEDTTGVLRELSTYILKIGANIVERQKRAESDKLRMLTLAEIELTNLTVRVRAE